MTKSDYIKLLLIILIGIFLVTFATSQSIMIDNQGRMMIEMSEEEKAIKISSSLIKSKTDLSWETYINHNKIVWEVKYNKDLKMYYLYKNKIKHYESSTITGIRSKYASDLLGREIKIQ